MNCAIRAHSSILQNCLLLEGKLSSGRGERKDPLVLPVFVNASNRRHILNLNIRNVLTTSPRLKKVRMFGPRRQTGSHWLQLLPILWQPILAGVSVFTELISFALKWTWITYIWRRIMLSDLYTADPYSWVGRKGSLVYTKCFCQLLFISVGRLRFRDGFSYGYSLHQFLARCVCFLMRIIFLSQLRRSVCYPLTALTYIHTEWVRLWYRSPVYHRHLISRQERKAMNVEERNTTVAREGGNS